MIDFVKKHTLTSSFLLLLLIVGISFSQATQFAPWQDDNALIFKLQHLEEQAGVFGAGSLGIGAYRYIAVPYIPIYKIFGLDTTAFYVWAIFFYFLGVVSIFLLAKELTKNNLLALLSGSIFAAGYIGSDGILRLFNSIQTSYSVIFVCLTLLFFYRFTRVEKTTDYFLSLVFFYIALETAFIRTQYLIFPVIIFCLLLLSKRKLFLLLPFLGIYYFVFSQNPDPRMQLLNKFVGGILDGQLQYLYGFFGSLGNLVIAQPLNIFLFNLVGNISLDYANRALVLELIFLLTVLILVNVFLRFKIVPKVIFSVFTILWFVFVWAFFHDSEFIFIHSTEKDISGIFSSFIGGLFLIVVSALWLLIKSKKTRSILVFALSWMLFNILAYSVYLPLSPLESIHRYLIHTFIAYAILIPILIYNLWGQRVSIIISSFIIFPNILFSISYQNKFIVEKSIPTNKFYGELKRFVQTIPKGSVLYFDVADDEISQQQFRDFFSVASMPDSTAIAIRYGLDRYDFKMTQNFDEFISSIDDKSLDTAFSFFYRADGLKDTTNITRVNLRNGEVVSLKDLDFDEQEVLIVTPLFLEFSALVIPDISIDPSCRREIPENQIGLVLDYILSRDDFLKDVNVQVSSQEKYQESRFLTDGNLDTLWRGSRGWWHVEEQEGIILDLGEVKNIGQIVWINGYANSTPLNYKFETSRDSVIWSEANKVIGGGKKSNGMMVVEDFEVRPARFIKMTIDSTFDNDSPAIGEIEAVESLFSGIDKGKVKTFENQISCVKDKDELKVLTEFINKRGIKTNVSWKTEKEVDNVLSFLAKGDGLYHKYSLLLPAGGIRLRDLKIEPFNIALDMDFTNMRIIYPGLNDLMRLNQTTTSVEF